MSMNIHGKSVNMDMDGKFHIHGKSGKNHAYFMQYYMLTWTLQTLITYIKHKKPVCRRI